MRNFRILLQSLSRERVSISRNLVHHNLNTSANDSICSTLISRNPNRNMSLNLNSLRRFTSSAQEQKPKVAPSEKVSGIVDELTGLTLLEMSDLVEVLRTKLGKTDMPGIAVMMPGMTMGGKGGGAKGGAAAEEVKAEKTSFDLKLEGGYEASMKIKIIKEVRACTDLGLKEAKELVEKAPTLLKKGVPKEEAEKIVAKLKEVGANVIME